jgi:hypothetical protein
MKNVVIGLVALISLSAFASEKGKIYSTGEGSSDMFISTSVREKVAHAHKETAIDDATEAALKKASPICGASGAEIVSVSEVACDWKADRYDWTYGYWKCSVMIESKCK